MPPEKLLNSCPSCRSVIDVTEHVPYSKVECPDCGTAIRVRSQFQQFEIEAEVGRGGMSRVFRAFDPHLGRQVALKILLEKFILDESHVAQFEKEARVMASFTHPNVVKLYSVGRDQGYYFLVMELVESGSLDEWLHRGDCVPESQLLEWGLQTTRGLQAAYESGLIHRDIKPGNILVAEDGSVKLVDFGLALMYAQEVDDSGEIWATPYYVAPEKLNNRPEDFRSDIYSLGASLYHLLLGRPPHDAKSSSIEELRQLKSRSAPVRSAEVQVSPKTCAIIEKMMAIDPGYRYTSHASLIADLELAARQLRATVVPGSPTRRITAGLSRKRRRGKAVAWALAGALALGLGGVLWHQWHGKAEGHSPATVPETDEVRPPGLTDLGTAFEEARQDLLRGDFPEASRKFADIHKSALTAQPEKSWAIFHHGLATLRMGDEDASREIFARLSEQADFPGETSETGLRQFMAQCGLNLGTRRPVNPESDGLETGKAYVGLGRLAFGLKNWEMGRFRDAAVGFNRFLEAANGDRSGEWLGRYRRLIEPHLADLRLLGEFPDLESAEDGAALEAKINEFEEALGKLETGERTRRQVRKMIATLKERRGALAREQRDAADRNQALRASEELKRLEALRQELEPLRKSLSFDEAVRRLDEENFESHEAKQRWEDMRYWWARADAFLEHVLKIYGRGFEGTIEKKGGVAVTAKVARATREGLEIEMAEGTTLLPLSELSLDSLAAMVLQELGQIRNANVYYGLQEALIAFADRTGLDEISRKQSALLQQENRPFRERWSRLEARRDLDF